MRCWVPSSRLTACADCTGWQISSLWILSALLLLPSSSSTSFDCSKILASKQRYDLSPLGGSQSLSILYPNPPSIHNTTYTINVCATLKRHSNVPAYDECPVGSRVCVTKRIKNEEDKQEVVSKVITIAGDFVHDGRDMNSKFERLRDISRDDEGRGGDEDAGSEGLRMTLKGGLYPLDNKVGRDGRKQAAIIDFVCDSSRTGLEGLNNDEGDLSSRELARQSDTVGEQLAVTDVSPSLQLISYGVNPSNEEEDVLRLRWLTKYACDAAATPPDKEKDPSTPDSDDPDSGSSSGHGFFFWLFVAVLPVVIATYLIFTCYLNYARNGASGLELLPHADTIQDFPYLLRDWVRRVVSTFQGGGSRGGYSAV